jgi:hypothetical protein
MNQQCESCKHNLLERLAMESALRDARAMLRVYLERREIETTRGQTASTIRDINSIIGDS